MQTLDDGQVRSVTSRITFSLGFAFLMLSFAAVAIPTFFLPGGYFLYGPLLVISLLSVVLIAQIRRAHTSITELTLVNSWKTIAVSAALLLSVLGFVPLASIAYDFYVQEQLRAFQLSRIQDIPNDKDFLKSALALHELMLGPGGVRHLRGNSVAVPKEIGQFRPYSVNASEQCLTLQLSQNNDRMLIIYSPESTLPRLHGKKIANNVHYWDRRP